MGIHTGPMMAGVVGRRKFSYDVWGDTVNLAARMVSAGAAEKINVSETVYNRMKGLFNFEARGNIGVKNKGRLQMFYLTEIKPDLSNGDGRSPNEAFHRQCEKLFPGYIPAS